MLNDIAAVGCIILSVVFILELDLLPKKFSEETFTREYITKRWREKSVDTLYRNRIGEQI
jgi:hypothetical protein